MCFGNNNKEFILEWVARRLIYFVVYNVHLGIRVLINKITSELNWSLKLRDNNERKNTLVTRGCELSDA